MSKATVRKNLNQKLRKQRVRSTVNGSAERPRLSVTITNLHVSAQIINDRTGDGQLDRGCLHLRAGWHGCKCHHRCVGGSGNNKC